MSSLSSQSPPSSPFITPSAENPPPLLPAQSAHPTDLSLSQHAAAAEEEDKVDKAAAGGAETETREPYDQSEDESDSLSQSLSTPWEPRAWPEGRQVLTHLVEGFVIQEGLQPFPVRTHTHISLMLIHNVTVIKGPVRLFIKVPLYIVQVNRSSLLVPEQVTKPQEVNGTNGKAALPVTDTIKQAEHSTDSEQEDAGDTDDAGNSTSV